jgi:hypothetical protein
MSAKTRIESGGGRLMKLLGDISLDRDNLHRYDSIRFENIPMK